MLTLSLLEFKSTVYDESKDKMMSESQKNNIYLHIMLVIKRDGQLNMFIMYCTIIKNTE